MNNSEKLEYFLHAQVECWNSGDKEGFLACYRDIAEHGLDIEYVGYPKADPWVTLGAMWDQQREKIRISILAAIVSGNEAACHHLNNRTTGEPATHTIELYRLENGHLSARYFIGG